MKLFSRTVLGPARNECKCGSPTAAVTGPQDPLGGAGIENKHKREPQAGRGCLGPSPAALGPQSPGLGQAPGRGQGAARVEGLACRVGEKSQERVWVRVVSARGSWDPSFYLSGKRDTPHHAQPHPKASPEIASHDFRGFQKLASVHAHVSL